MSDPVFRGALDGAPAINGSISVAAIDDRGMIDLRGDLADNKFAATVKKALGFALPDKPRTSSKKGDILVLWLSPDQWLISCPRPQVEKLHIKLSRSLAEIHSLTVDVSDMRSIIRLHGAGAREVLMKGAPVDLTLPDYDPGSVRRLRFAEQAALVHMVSDDPDSFDLYVFRSYARYVWDWLAATSTKQSRLEIFTRQPSAKV